MKNNFLGEMVISSILILLLLFMINPLDFWMPTPANMMFVIALGVFFMIFASFVWKEKSTDERDTLHRGIASRFAYLTGTGLLVVSIIFQSLSHMIDGWLIFILGAMILAKIVGLLYGRIRY